MNFNKYSYNKLKIYLNTTLDQKRLQTSSERLCYNAFQLTSGLRLVTSRTEFPGIPPAPGMAILPVTAEEVSARGPRAPGTPGTDRPF